METLPPVLDAVETPAAVVDIARATANALRVADYSRGHGLRWRPHVKTHKSTRIARIQLDAGATGLTVATPREAEVMAAVCDDLLLAYPPVGPSKLRRLMELPERVALTVALDSVDVLDLLDRAARDAGRSVGVLVELDAGLRRVGVERPQQAVALAARAAELTGVQYRGLMFYPGHIRVHVGRQGPLLDELSKRLRSFVTALQEAGLPPEVVSGGSTPTLWRSHEIGALTEIRPGTCIYNDRDAVALGACERDDCAYTILATVVSTAVSGQAVVDAGSKALAKESFRADGGGYGVLLDRPEILVSALSEEHGTLDLSGTTWRPAVGQRVRIVPNHVCVSVNLQDALVVLDGEAVERWQIEGRGRAPAPVPVTVGR